MEENITFKVKDADLYKNFVIKQIQVKIREFIESYCFWVDDNYLRSYFDQEKFYVDMLSHFFIDNKNIIDLINDIFDIDGAKRVISKFDLFIESWGESYMNKMSEFYENELEENTSS